MKSMTPLCRLAVLLLLSTVAVRGAEPPKKSLPLPGEVFTIEGHTAFVILPGTKPADRPIPWVWYAPTLNNLPSAPEKWMFQKFTDAGIAIAGIDVGESYGSPQGRALFSAFHQHLTQKRGFAAKAILLGRSRGGLMTLCWAAENADKVAGFAGIYPVCNIASYPGIARACGAYGLSAEQLTAQLKDHNPIDRLDALVKAKVPLFAIHGDVDTLVPLDANSGELKKRYEALGGTMQLIVPKGQGHNMWEGFFQCQELVDFVIVQSGQTPPTSTVMTLSSPADYQVVQRSAKDKGQVEVAGSLAASAMSTLIETRLVVDGKPQDWRPLDARLAKGTFRAPVEVPAGGWYRLEVRAVFEGKLVATTAVEHVGVGEVFVVAGQSNSANYGQEKQKPTSGKVAAFDGRRWEVANDPQPGAGGNGGSFMPTLGDAIAERFGVPVGFVACGIGATSVREWLPKGTKFPNPPTLISRVQELPAGGWESKGQAYEMFTTRMRQLGPKGFRAVLWHQGESDANQKDPTRTLPGKLYREYLEKLIRDSRKEIGWEVPWFVAQASYHVPGDEASPDIRDAQASLWKDGIALQGPDSDAIKGPLRERDGKGVHFSGDGLREHAKQWSEKITPWLEQQLK